MWSLSGRDFQQGRRGVVSVMKADAGGSSDKISKLHGGARILVAGQGLGKVHMGRDSPGGKGNLNQWPEVHFIQRDSKADVLRSSSLGGNTKFKLLTHLW